MVLVSCQQDPTPHPSDIDQRLVNVTVPAFVNQPLPLTVNDLLHDPESYSGKIVQVSGQFFRKPTIVCNEPYRPAPDRWYLVNGEQQISAGGSKSQLTSLAPAGLTIIVEGRWQFWRGVIGCGKESEIQELWYLDISHIVAPNPITMATLTPGLPPLVQPAFTPLTSTIIAEVPTIIVTDTTTSSNNPSPTALVTTPDVQATTPAPIPPVLPATNTPTPSFINTNTPVLTVSSGEVTPTRLEESTQTPTPEKEGEVTPTPDEEEKPTETPTTVAEATRTPTPSSTPTTGGVSTATPIVAATPTEGDFVDKGVLASQDLVVEVLEDGQVDRWTFQVEASTLLTVHVASPLNTDMVVTITDREGNVLLSQNNASLGEPEIVAGFSLSSAGNYYIRISEASGHAGTYSMILQDGDAYAFIFMGTIQYGNSVTRVMVAESDHFWHFVGSEGDSLIITVTPNDTSDLFVEIYGTDAAKIDAVDVGGDGVAERMEFTVPTSGFYAIRVGEYNFEPANYTLTLMLN